MSKTAAISSIINTVAKMHAKRHFLKIIFAAMFNKLVLLLFASLSIQLEAENRHLLDSIRYDLKQDKRLFFGLDGKNSVITNFPIKLFGLQVGYIYNKRTSLFLGLYNSYKDERIYSNPTAGEGKVDSNTVYQKLKLNYVSIGLEYAFYDSKKWRLSVPVSLGTGSGLDRIFKKHQVITEATYRVAPIELAFNAKYKLTWWLWLGAGLGTRLSFSSSKFNGSIYSFGLSIKTGEIYRRSRDWYRNR